IRIIINCKLLFNKKPYSLREAFKPSGPGAASASWALWLHNPSRSAIFRRLAHPGPGATNQNEDLPFMNEDSTPPENTSTAPGAPVTEAIQCKPLEVVVGDRGIERAIKHLKRKMASEGILRELK